ncbi:MAG: FAD-binding oxidoreductase [Candidatus Helarchaeota archaeon]|nr:FAD-binding oxidoreductase [Candidatus Helarchaeota archaeon]
MEKLATITEELIEAIGKAKVKTEDFHLIPYSRDWSPRDATETQMPQIAVRPTSTEDVSIVLKIANEHRCPVTTIGGLTGMGGGAVPIYGGIALDSKGLNQVLEIDEKNMTVTTQTGITVLKLNEALKDKNLWWPHDPESKPSSTVGAAIACDNDSTFGIKYGKIGDFLLNAKVVLGTGEILRVGHRKALCTSTGYKLHWLLIASEGTLGVITEATLKIFLIPETRAITAVVFKTISAAIEGLKRLLQSGLSIESAHVNCKQRLGFYTFAYREKHGRDPDIPDWAGAILFVTVNGDKDVVNFSHKYAIQLLESMGGVQVKEQDMLDSWWKSKHTLQFVPMKQKWPDSQRQKKFGAADLGIPIGRIEEAYEHYQRFASQFNIEILGMCVYNERPNRISPSISFAVFVDDSKPEEVQNFYNYVREMSKMAIDLEGTMSTYIGDGDRLGGFNRLEHGKALDYMRKIKEIFDPNNILNPGKKFESKWIE